MPQPLRRLDCFVPLAMTKGAASGRFNSAGRRIERGEGGFKNFIGKGAIGLGDAPRQGQRAGQCGELPNGLPARALPSPPAEFLRGRSANEGVEILAQARRIFLANGSRLARNVAGESHHRATRRSRVARFFRDIAALVGVERLRAFGRIGDPGDRVDTRDGIAERPGASDRLQLILDSK